ncbi:nucleotidyltransferase domain-containing protein [Streptomyces sp. NBC_01591]|uniref:nucleotidyltransferase domain-containing protein n=1 Tax=Streptomyces sp. NBC_01591 TaxID=2975888 RepID=UPI002DDC01FA|nr:nucleotidyltransferase domain-containing protein [Streptomyces sp. NBC_01591]WSD71867.1 nucleotidyltransferase domain-containing protein [Streptomyces sp. NBC_01591]
MTDSVAALAVALAEERFADNLALAFVGGSYARGTNRATSDIDVFVLLHRSDHGAEREFAEDLQALHLKAGLQFDHCGELFDVATIETLLAFTEQALTAAPALQQAACYKADCSLSIFRKGDVVFKFLADPKIHVVDPASLLSGLEMRAAGYFERWPMPRVQEFKKYLALPPGSQQERAALTWRQLEGTSDWVDTPVGIGLERWFGSSLQSRAQGLSGGTQVMTAPESKSSCPLPLTEDHARQAFATQCLAFIPGRDLDCC